MKCPKCSYIQGPRAKCKKCGTGLSPAGPETNPALGRIGKPVGNARRAEAAPAVGTARPAPAAAMRAAKAAPRAPSQAQPAAQAAAASPPALAAPGATEGRRAASFNGSGGRLLVIHLLNGLLTMLTLGVYVFWGKVKVRRYLLGQTEFEGDRFEYHGTGKELARGWSKAMLIFGLPIMALSMLPRLLGGGEAMEALVGLLIYASLLVFMPLAVVSARRYRMSRTSWRGIRFSFRGPVKDFIKIFVKGALLTAVTLGLYGPYFQTKWHDFMTAYTYFGNQRFEFDGQGKELFRPYLVALLLFPFTLGISFIWYRATRQRFFWNHTTVGQARFTCTVTGGALLGLYLTNALLLIVTMGLAYPWVQVRNARFHAARVSLDGALDLDRIQQEARSASATGEELAGFFDLDLGWT